LFLGRAEARGGLSAFERMRRGGNTR
jgi:hypothetical protein